MIRSGKALRHIYSSANNDETKEDIISNLPDSLLVDILSLLPRSDVKQTRILSKRWKNLFAFLPNLCFRIKYLSLDQVQNFDVFVDQTLATRGGMPIEKLLLKGEHEFDFDCQCNLLRTFVRFKVVQELEFRFPMFWYDWDLFKIWDTLVGLTLEGGFMFNVPNDKVIFPCLKKLSLLSVDYRSCESAANLFSGCPVLEELYVERRGSYWDLAVFKVSSISLKILRINFSSIICNNWSLKVVIDAPKLEHIYIDDHVTTDYSLRNSLSLVEADICHSSKIISELIPFLSSAKVLRLNVHSKLVRYHLDDLNMPMFANLVKLVIGLGLDFLPVWLNSMPNLEHITLSIWRRLFNVEQNLPEEPPACLRFKMKEIIVHKDRYLSQEEFNFIRYLLKHSTILENFRIYAGCIDLERREQLLNFHRGSERCRIEFV